MQLLGRISLQIYLLHDPLLRFAMLKLHLYQVTKTSCNTRFVYI